MHASTLKNSDNKFYFRIFGSLATPALQLRATVRAKNERTISLYKSLRGSRRVCSANRLMYSINIHGYYYPVGLQLTLTLRGDNDTLPFPTVELYCTVSYASHVDAEMSQRFLD